MKAAVALVVLGILGLGGITARSHFLSQLAVAEAEAKAARAETSRALSDAATAVRFSGESQLRVNALQRERNAAVARADSAARTAARLRGAFSAVAAAAPDTCRVLVVVADSALAAQDSVSQALRASLVRSQAAEAVLQASVDTLLPALIKLRSASSALVAADHNLARAVRPSLFARLLPRPGVGIAAGFDPAGTPRVITGITLGWSF